MMLEVARVVTKTENRDALVSQEMLRRYFRRRGICFLFLCATFVVISFYFLPTYKANGDESDSPSLSAQLFKYTRTPNVSVTCPRLLILIFSAPGEKKRREAIRATWGHSRRLEASWAARVFVIGGGSHSDQLDVEQRDFGDILTDGQLIDNYNNLTRKVVSALHWASAQPWQQLRYIAKIDSDNFVNVNFLRYLADKTWRSKGSLWMTGYRIAGRQPYRDKKHKWFVSKKEYRSRFYPPYFNGPHYMMTLEAARKATGNQTLLEIAAGRALRMEDVYVSGIVRERHRIPAITEVGFFPHLPNVNRFLREMPVFAAVHSLRNHADNVRFQNRLDEPKIRFVYLKKGFG